MNTPLDCVIVVVPMKIFLLFCSKHRFSISPDGLWHHVTVTWENVNGSYQVFVDGALKILGHGLKRGSLVSGRGTFALGNDYDSGGFHANDAFVGNISRVNIWGFVLPEKTIICMAQHCGRESGERAAWWEFKQASFSGVVKIREPSSCELP